MRTHGRSIFLLRLARQSGRLLSGVFLMVLCACSAPPEAIGMYRHSVTQSDRDGTVTTTTTETAARATSTRQATEPPSVAASEQGGTSTGGASEGVTAEGLIASNTRWIGGAMIVLGAIGVGVSFFVPIVPLGASAIIAGMGAGVLLLPAVVPYVPWIILAGVAYVAIEAFDLFGAEKKGRVKSKSPN